MKLIIQRESDGSEISVEVDPDHKMWAVWEIIAEQFGDTSDVHLPVHKGEAMLYDGDTPVWSVPGLSSGSVVRWVRWLEVWVMSEAQGRGGWWSVWRDATVGELKRRIQKVEKISADEQLVLHYKDEELADDGMTLQACGVRMVEHGSDPTPDAKREAILLLSIRSKSTEHSAQLKMLNARVTELEQQQGTQDATVREMRQEIGEEYHQIDEKQQMLALAEDNIENRVRKLELDNQEIRKRLDKIEAKPTDMRETSDSIRQKLRKNYTTFLDLDLDIADYLYQENVLSISKYKHILDSSRNQAGTDKMREMLLKVFDSESNAEALYKILKERTDNKSRELAKLLE